MGRFFGFSCTDFEYIKAEKLKFDKHKFWLIGRNLTTLYTYLKYFLLLNTRIFC